MDRSRIRRLFNYFGIFCSCLSFLALLLSVALPGVGWVLAALTVITNSLLVPFIGRRYVIIALIVSGIHLFSFGPLSLISAGGQGQAPMTFLLAFVIVPAVIAVLSILFPKLNAKKHKSD
jgi:hypothetical protein